jgi:hypothetical protein
VTAALDASALRMPRQARDRIDRDYAEPVGIPALAAVARLLDGALHPGCELTTDITLDNGMRWLTVRPQGQHRPGTAADGPGVRPYGIEAVIRDDSGNWFSFTQRTG